MYGRYAIFQAKDGQGRKLADLLNSDSPEMKKSGAIIYSVSLEEGNDDIVHVFAGWPTKEAMVKSFKQDKVSSTVEAVKLLLKTPPDSKNLLILD
ncbi:MAG: hypothetical protein CME65_12755 [Halobacteriovoraceae bacterium]|nr:hypothetical protein [Halobacteriovoraceae bacterium]|tara:strand:- start:234 stop:518 length:285 start_codon:yes stop_codon:yes gene_type:complete